MTYIGVNTVGAGFYLPEITATCVFRGATSAPLGTVVALCIKDNDDITNDSLTLVRTPDGSEASMFSSVTSAYDIFAVRHGIFGVLQEDASDLEQVKVLLRGKTKAFTGITTTNGNAANGTYGVGVCLVAGHTTSTGQKTGYLYGVTANNSPATAGDDRKFIGVIFAPSSEFTASPTSGGQLLTVLFDGINGFGSTGA